MVSLSLALVVISLAAVLVLPWWSVVVVVAVLMANVAWLRRVAVSECATRRTQAHARGSAADTAGPTARHSAYFEDESEPEPVVAVPVAGVAGTAEPIEPPTQADLSGWAPVPVPPPTYTLKA